MEALQDLQKTIELNDNRAVYRSRLLLDEDLAAKSASLGRIYRDLGFEEMALRQGWQSLNTDPTNYSAHRLLADVYSSRPRHEVARVSELLQSQLLQPLNITPVQTQLFESNLKILEGTGPASASFNELNPLFTRNRYALQVDGVAGSNSSRGDEISLSGLYDFFSFNISKFHNETDGFRENNDINQDIYNAYLQAEINKTLNVQAEYRRRHMKQGDLSLNFDLEQFDPLFRQEESSDIFRLGMHLTHSIRSHFLASYIQKDVSRDTLDSFSGPDDYNDEEEGYVIEAQHLFVTPDFSVISGISRFDTEIFLDRWRVVEANSDNYYGYSQINFPDNFRWTIGISYNTLDDDFLGDIDEYNPKLGLTWNPLPETVLRLAYFKVLRRNLIADQTLEPTQVAGFSQFFDDINGTVSNKFGVAIDLTINRSLSLGLEYTNRKLRFPIALLSGVVKEDWEEHQYRAYLYYTLLDTFAFKTEYIFEEFDRDIIVSFLRTPTEMDTQTVPVSISYFNPSGFFARISNTFVKQDITSVSGATNSDEFSVVDLSIGYRLPKRFGVIKVMMMNAFDSDFNFQNIAGIRTAATKLEPLYYRERSFWLKCSLSF